MGHGENEEHERELGKITPSTSGEESSLGVPERPVPAYTKEPDITAVGAPCANSENVLDIMHRGRSGHAEAHEMRDSHDSERTQSDDGGHDHQVATPHRNRSRAQSTTRSMRSIQKDAVKVPQGERRGLFARLAVIAEVTEPYDYTRRKKWTITCQYFLGECACYYRVCLVFDRP